MFGNYKFNSLLKHPGYNKGKGGGGGGGGNTTATTYTTNIPEYAKPYVNTMLGTAQQQIYDINDQGQVTGFRPYVPYSENPQDYVAPFSPLQMQSLYGAADLQLPGQFAPASGLASASGLGSLGIAGQAAQAGQNYYGMATNPYAMQAFMNPYVSASLAPQLAEMERQYGISGTQQQSNATRAGAFGGTREALMAAENQRNKNMAMNQAIAQGYDKAFQAAQQAQQFGAGLGIQGQQAALSGLGQAGQAGATLGNLGTAQLAAQQGILNTQNLYGQQMQQQQQNIINQAIQNYANQQQYPMQQLANMSSLLRGLPMQASTTQTYQAPPSPLATAAGLGTGIAGIASLMKAEGGVVKSYAGGGITSLENRQRIAEGLTPKQLETSMQNKTIPMQIGEAILRDNANMQERANMAQAAQPQMMQPQGGMGIEAAPSNLTPAFAGGGIISFAEGGDVEEWQRAWEARQEQLSDPDRAMSAFERNIFSPSRFKYEMARNKVGAEGRLGSKSMFEQMTPAQQKAYDAKRQILDDIREGKYDPTGKPLTPTLGIASAAQPAAPATAKPAGTPELTAERIGTGPTYGTRRATSDQTGIAGAFAQGRKDIEALKDYKGKYDTELQDVLNMQRAELNKPEMTREEAEKIAARAYEGSPYAEYEKTIRDRAGERATEKEHALGRGLLAMSEQLLSNPLLATGLGKGLGEFGKVYGAELKEIKAAQRMDEKALADIEQAKRLEQQGKYKEAERLFELGQTKRDKARTDLAGTLSTINAQDLNKAIQVTKAGVDLDTDLAKTQANLNLGYAKIQSDENLYREGLKGARGAGLKGDWTNQQVLELKQYLGPEADKLVAQHPLVQRMGSAQREKEAGKIAQLREEILQGLLQREMGGVTSARFGGAGQNTISFDALKPFLQQ